MLEVGSVLGDRARGLLLVIVLRVVVVVEVEFECLLLSELQMEFF